MIETMKKVTIASVLTGKEKFIESIRDFGVLHLSEKKASSSVYTQKLEELSERRNRLAEYEQKKMEKNNLLEEDRFSELDEKVAKTFRRISELEEEKKEINFKLSDAAKWGPFDAKALKEVQNGPYAFDVCHVSKRELAELVKSKTRFIRLSDVDKITTVAVFDKTDFAKCILPEEDCSSLEKRLEEANDNILECKKILSSCALYLNSYDYFIEQSLEDVSFSEAENSVNNEDGILLLCGYIPQSCEEKFRTFARSRGFAFAISDVAQDDENVPTKIRYNKVTGIIKPLFDLLGTVPGYREYDVSFVFLVFFALFFAMIIGDAFYGLLFTLLGVAIHIKTKKASNLVLLIYTVGLSTVAWGAVTGTWLGLESAMNVPLLRKMVIPAIANFPQVFGRQASSVQNSVMKFCFMIGTIQLSLACFISIARKIKDKCLGWLSDLGWLLSINALYYVVLLLVIGENVDIKMTVPFIAAGFLLVVLFGGMEKGKSFSAGLKAGLGNAFTVFLNTISAFGNIMSYIRLFAVGMASLAIAQSFNDMAGSLGVLGVIVFILGHVLNIVMGLLSVIVHGARLNLLEFSGQLGMEWTGIAYNPFKKGKKEKV